MKLKSAFMRHKEGERGRLPRDGGEIVKYMAREGGCSVCGSLTQKM